MKFRLSVFACAVLLGGFLLSACSDTNEATTASEVSDSDNDSAAARLSWSAENDKKTEKSSPADRFTVNDDGTVSDQQTGLTWMICSKGQEWDGATCTGAVKTYQWQEANRLGQDFSYAGKSDWRLPTMEELKSLVYCSSGREIRREDGTLLQCDGDFEQPTIAKEFFPGTPVEWFWTATTSPHDNEYFWSVHFGQGYVLDNDQINSYAVRLVR